jgi:DNA mismatch endonuclease (patch repair protein)
MALRRALWSRGIRGYRVNCKSLPGTPDIAFSARGLVVFVHGCFWHGCPDCSNYRLPKTNSRFWEMKLIENRERDARSLMALEALGLQVLVVWECELERDVEQCVERVIEMLRSREKASRSSPSSRQATRLWSPTDRTP